MKPPKEANQKRLTHEQIAELVAALSQLVARAQANAKTMSDKHIKDITCGVAAWKRAKEDLKRFAREIEDGIDAEIDPDEVAAITQPQAQTDAAKPARKAKTKTTKVTTDH